MKQIVDENVVGPYHLFGTISKVSIVYGNHPFLILLLGCSRNLETNEVPMMRMFRWTRGVLGFQTHIFLCLHLDVPTFFLKLALVVLISMI
jgi:hypothetical protein